MASADQEVIRIAPQLVLRTPSGGDLTVYAVRARIAYAGEALRDVQLWFEIRPEDWPRVDAERLFHLAPEVRGPCFAGSFLPDAPIAIEARLGTNETTLMSLVAEGIWEVGGVLLAAELHPAVHGTEAWYALLVKQRRGVIEGGFLTTYGGWKPSVPVDPGAGHTA